MKKISHIYLSLLLFSFLSSGCSSNNNHADNDSFKTDSIEELPFPEVPEDILEPNQRANFVITRFWEDMDFSDTKKSTNREFMEQNFSNFISFFPYADDDVKHKAVAELLQKAQSNPNAYEMLVNIADKYLYDPESPMLSEDIYIVFLEEMLKKPFPNAEARNRQKHQLEETAKNRPGTTATNFDYIMRDGKQSDLLSTPANGKLLLLFYNPDCDHCKGVISAIKEDENINRMLATNELTILAIYSGPDKELWQNGLIEMPNSWLVGYNPDEIESEELYSLRALPSLYLLDSKKKVIAKDVSLQQLLQN